MSDIPEDEINIIMRGAYLWSRRIKISRDFQAQEINDWNTWKKSATPKQALIARALYSLVKDLNDPYGEI